MLFNSYEFIFVFLPLAVGGYFAFGRMEHHSRLANVWLLCCSLFFYGWWDIRYVPLLVGSIIMNYILSAGILWACRSQKNTLRRVVFGISLLANLILLGYFKYMDLFISTWNLLTHSQTPIMQLVLPLGISFFTITQVLYLLDCYEGITKDHDFLDYALFVSFFPHLLCGPILFHRQMMSQFKKESLRRVQWENFASGITLFIIGLAKKILIADCFSSFANEHFYAPAPYNFYVSWLAMAAYAVQLYFDFSGYSDMAVGIARMMNIKIPINFNSPLRASTLTDFWQRWHISLTQAITACVYIPLVNVLPRRFASVAVASFLTFFIVGIWHGAGWTFVIFALLHAAGITVNQAWRYYALPMPHWLSKVILFSFLIPTLVIIRAHDMPTAISLLSGMIGQHGFSTQGIMPKGDLLLLAGALIAMLFAPNSNEIAKKLKPTWHWFIALVVLFCLTLVYFGRASDFLYFQF